ncbi:gluconokinase, GntK/IdnK-type [Streptomyces fructofermentans]|uniref:gluconokinase, GntK/IdnK-type n=1 Tax=Streptomyces fructofermentans TaxID=152141 RepID=UPI0033E0B79E
MTAEAAPRAVHAGAPRLVLIVGMSGSGKTTVGRLLAERLGWRLRDGDEFHSPENRARMASGHPLTDADRQPWLDAIGTWMDGEIAAGEPAVVTCSALKRAYRDKLLSGRPEARLVYLHGSRALIHDRLASRHGHFFPARLLESQLADLQEPGPDEHPLTVEIDQTPEAIVTEVLSLMYRGAEPEVLGVGAAASTAAPAEGVHVPSSATGDEWRLSSGGHTAVVVRMGAGLRHYEVDGRPVLDGFDAGSPVLGGRGQILAPWPNRVGDGRYRFGGQDLQLPLNESEKNNAIHGLLRWHPWQLLARGDDMVLLGTTLFPQPGYPFLLDVTAEYRLGPDGLDVTLRATNTGDAPAPYGVGQHPYVTVGTATADSVLLTVPARYRLKTDERGLPTGRESVDGTPFDFRTARPIGEQPLDTAFTGIDRDARGRAFVRLAHPSGLRGVDVELGEGTRYVQIYTGDTPAEPGRRRTGVAVEPMSCPADAFRSGTGLTVLEPGARHTLHWGLRPWERP